MSPLFCFYKEFLLPSKVLFVLFFVMVASFSSTLFYFISTASSPPYYVTSEHIDVANNLTLSTALSDALPFRFYSAPNASEYNICNTGSNAVTLCIDIFRDNTSQPHLQTPGYFTGQQWTITNSTDSSGNAVYQLQNDYSGQGAFLTSISNADEVYMKGEGVGLTLPNGDSNWLIKDTNEPQNAPTSTNSLTSTVSASAATASTSHSSPSSSSTPGSTSSTDLSTGAKAGIGVGVAAVIILATVAGVCLWRRRPAKTSATSSETAYVPAQQEDRNVGDVRSILIPAPVAATEVKPSTWTRFYEMNGTPTENERGPGRPELPG